MIRKLVLLFMLIGGVPALMAQNTEIGGKVVTKKKEPVPGARVIIEGTDEEVLTNLDGTFTLHTPASGQKVAVRYVGMQPKRQNASADMTIVLTRTNWWNWVPDHYQFYVAPQVAFPEKGMKNPAFGLTVGVMKTWGAYIKGVYSSLPKTDFEWDDFGFVENSNLPWTQGSRKNGMMAIVVGGSVRLGCPLNLNLGVGYMKVVSAWKLGDDVHYMNYNPDSYTGVCFDAGLTLRLGQHFLLQGGVLYGGKQACAPTAGIGYCF